MQQRRYRPGDVLDDYCPRERRITDHAIVAMIDDHIKQTRCVVCDAEHEYKDGKVPPRRKKPQAALFTQVLDGITGPQPPSRAAAQLPADDVDDDVLGDDSDADGEVVTVPVPVLPEAPVLAEAAVLAEAPGGERAALVAAAPDATADRLPEPDADLPRRDEGPWRRQLIRAALPRPEGQPPPQTRPATDFTIRQPTNARGHRHGGRRTGGHSAAGSNGHPGPMRFGRSGQGSSQGHGQNQGQGQGQGPGGRRRRGRGGKKNH